MKAPAVVLGLSAAGLVLLVWLALGTGTTATAPPAPAAPTPAAPGPDPVGDFADPVEDAVFEVEDALSDLAAQLARGASAGAAFHLAADYEGSPLLRDGLEAGRAAAGVQLRRSGPDPERVGRAEAVRSPAPPDRVIFKLPSAALRDGALSCELKIDAYRREGPRAVRTVSKGAAEFNRPGSRWLLRRFSCESRSTEDGELRFPEATDALGLRIPYGDDDRNAVQATFGWLFMGGIAAGDFDGDGRTDLFVPEIGSGRLFRNEGGRFRECAAELGVRFRETGGGALFLDVENDGDLDLLVASYEPESTLERATKRRVPNAGRRSLSLYRNDGGRFTDVTRAAGLEGRGPAMGLAAADVDGDGDLDVYVCRYRDETLDDPDAPREIPRNVGGARDGAPNQLWINRGDGTFTEEAAARGVADTGWSLAAGFSDYDGDGRPDLFVANDYGTPRLYRNLGKGLFEDATAKAGVGDAGFGMGVLWTDVDGNGRPDLYVSNMYSTAGNRILARDNGSLPAASKDLLLRMASGNTLFLNRGDGTFENVTEPSGVGRAG